MKTLRNPGLSALLITALAVILAAPSAQAIKRKKYRHRWFDNSWSVGLMFDTHPDDEEFRSTTLTLKHQTSRNSGWRLNLTGMERELEYNRRRVFDGDYYMWEFSPYHDINLEGGAISFQQVIYPTIRSNTVRIYWAVGPRFSALDADNDIFFTLYDEPLFGGADWAEPDEVTRFGLGLEGDFGVEWFLGENISLLGELGINVEKRWYACRVDFYREDGRHWTDTEVFDDDLVVESPWVNLGFAIHF
jgi:hypothetical protein